MKKGRAKIAVISVFLALFAGLGIFLCIWFFGADYSDFDALVKKEGEIPGLDSGLSPQGLCALPEESGYRFAMSGYLKGEPSRVYLFGGDKDPKYFTLRKEKEGMSADISTHFGGITCTGEDLFVASGTYLERVSLAEALNAENGAALSVSGSFKVKDVRSIAYCYCYNGLLYAGEFYRPDNYETDESHHLKEGEETNYALVFAYEIVDGGIGEEPLFALSVREQVQGIAVYEGGIALSTSYGLPDSEIYFYENVLAGEAERTYNGLPLFRLDSGNCTRVLQTPCMSEEIFERDGRLYLLYESASDQYKNFVRRQIFDIYSLELS